ncbi:MAG TPA: NAD-dependent epimerase/dehydratase family protein [Steroidobacteraceae bacterium]|nr:NAD-dependent epimerase/dehydratase family protein [Steroidobacteraceae bacterium]
MSRTPRVLVTGSTGFVGMGVCKALTHAGFRVRGVVRPGRQAPIECDDSIVVDSINEATDWGPALEDVDLVVHLAARAHTVSGSVVEDKEFTTVNAHGTRALAAASASRAVRRFLYLSSVKVNGRTTTDKPFTAEDVPRPDGPYGISKWLGENYLNEIARTAAMESIVIRSPLVYGPGVKANFLTLMNWVHRGVPLPFGRVKNIRSLVSIWSLVDLIVSFLRCPQSVHGTWMAADTDLSTPALVEHLANAMGRPVRLFDVPVGALCMLGGVAGLGSAMERLCGSLAVDMTATSRALSWQPPIRVEDAIGRTVTAYLQGNDL